MNLNTQKTRYSKEELQEFKTLIDNKLIASRKELSYLQDQIRDLSENPESKSMSLEGGSSTLEKEYLNQMASRTIKHIKHLENALIRIGNQTYGICRETGKLIQKARLHAVPHATLSIEAKRGRASKEIRRRR